MSLTKTVFRTSTWVPRAIAALWLSTVFVLSYGQQSNPYGWSRFHGNAQSSGQSLGANALPVPQWTTALGGVNLPASPAIGPDGTIFIGVGTAVRAFNGVSGLPGWTYNTTGSVLATPAVSSNNVVYVGSVNTGSSSGNNVYALNGLTGALLWSYAASGPLYASPAIGSDGTVYVASWDGYVTALDGNTGSKKWSVSPANNGTDAFKSSIAIGPDGILYIGSFNGNFYALHPGDGSVGWTYPTNGHIVSSPAFSTYGFDAFNGITGTLYIGSDDNSLYAIRSDGSLEWTALMGNPVTSSPAISPDLSIVVGNEDHHVYSFSPTSGSLNWFFTTGAPIESSVVVGIDGTVYVGPDDGNVYAINGTNGAQIFAYGVSGASSSPAVSANGALFVGTASSLLALQSVYVDQFGISPTSILAGKTAIGTIDLNQQAPAGGAYVGLNFDPNYFSAPSYVIVPQGQKTASFVIQSIGVTTTSTFTLSVNPGISQTANVTVTAPQVISVSVNPSSVPELSPSAVTVVLNGPIGPSDVSLSISSNNAAAVLPPNKYSNKPPILGKHSSMATFPIQTLTVDKLVIATISSSFGGGSGSAPLTILPANLTSITLNPTTVPGGLPSVATLTLDNLAGPSGAVVSISSSTASATAPSTVTIPKDATSATFNISTSPVATKTDANIVATLLGVPRSATLTILPIQLSSITLNPPKILGGKNSSGTVTLSGPAGAGGLQVFLKSSNSIATVPNSVTVPNGQSTAIFNIPTNTTSVVQTAVITGTQGSNTAQATLTVDPPSPASVSLSPSTVLGGTSLTGLVTLDGPANPGGEVVTLASSDPSASVPPSLTIPAGASTGSFTINTTGVNTTTQSTISATASGITASAVLTVNATSVSLVSFTPSSIVGGNTATGTVTLTGPASPAGTVVNLAPASGLVQVPTTVTVAPGQRTGSFPAQTAGVDSATSVNVVATFNGQVTGKLFITGASLSSLVLNPSTVAGLTQPTGVAQLNGLAGPSGITVTLASDSKNAVVPASIKIFSGNGSGSFLIAVKQVTKAATADISASSGGVTQTAILHMVPLALASLSVSPSEVSGGANATGTLTLNGTAPKAGASVHVSSSTAAITVPASVAVPSGSTSTSFVAKTHGVSAKTTGLLTATFGGVSSKASLTVDPPTLEAISVAPSPITGGFVATGTVVLSGAAPASGIKVLLASSLINAVVPASVVVPSGKMTATFAVKTSSIGSEAKATLTGTFNGNSVKTSLDIKPTVLVSLVLKPTSVSGGKTSTATVTVSGPAPAGGFTIQLSCSSGSASVPAKVVIPVGKTSATFTVKTVKVTQSTTALLTAGFESTSAQATLTIN